MSQPKFNHHDIFTLTKDINPEIKSGIVGVILEKYNDTHFLVEIVKQGGNLDLAWIKSNIQIGRLLSIEAFHDCINYLETASDYFLQNAARNSGIEIGS